MDKRAIRIMVKQIAVYLANNIPYSEIEIRQNLLKCLQGLAKELDITEDEFGRMIE